MSNQIICRASSSRVSSAVPKTKTDPDGVLSEPAVEARAGGIDDVMIVMMLMAMLLMMMMMMMIHVILMF